jgi:hypothetical protein
LPRTSLRAAAPTVVAAVARVLGGIDVLVHGVGASFTHAGGALGWGNEDWRTALQATSPASAASRGTAAHHEGAWLGHPK